HLEQLFLGQATGDEVIPAVADADDEVLPHRVAHGAEDLLAEPGPVLEAAAVLIGARVGERGDKVFEQVATVEGNVAAVVAALFEAHGGGGPAVDHLADLGLGHDVRPLAVALFPGIGRTPQGRARVPGVAAPAAVRGLRETERAGAGDGRARRRELRGGAVVPSVDARLVGAPSWRACCTAE